MPLWDNGSKKPKYLNLSDGSITYLDDRGWVMQRTKRGVPVDEVLVAFNNPNNKPLGRGLTPPPGYTFVTSNGNYVVNNGLYVIAKVT